MSDLVRETDFVARLGGDEFAVLCPDTSLTHAADVASSIRDAIRGEAFGRGATMTCSAGRGDHDAASADRAAPEVVGPTVDLLAELAGDGAALELAVGTGRIAVPLAARGVPVHGIDVSRPMVDRMRAKPGGDAVAVTIGDMATTRVEGRFRLAFLVYNTISNLPTQDAQVACFANVAVHLEPGGCFVVECSLPELRRLPPGETDLLFEATPTHVGYDDYAGYDATTQVAWSHHLYLDGGRVERFSTRHRHVWPSELDLMARLAGLTLRHRWDGLDRSPFTGASRSHVSVWQTA